MTYRYMVGDRTAAIYRAVDPDGTRLGNSGRRAAEYCEYDDRVEVVVAGDNRHVKVKQYDSGKAEASLVYHTHTYPRAREALPDINVHELLSAVRRALGPQTPTPPPYKPGDYSLR